jgi:hypothetical protein
MFLVHLWNVCLLFLTIHKEVSLVLDGRARRLGGTGCPPGIAQHGRYKKPTAIYANMKAFLVNRVGDFGFILGIGFEKTNFL